MRPQRLNKNSNHDELDKHIINTVKEDKPETVNQLVTLIKQKYQLPDQKILNHILTLQEKKQIHLTFPQTQPPQTLAAYLGSGQAAWYWITVILTAATTLVVFTVPEDAYPLAYSRNILGTIFVLWLPGYAFIKALFPKQLPIKTTEKDLDTIERIALSVGMSIALVPIVGLLLNYTEWGIRLTPITLSLTALTLTFATAAIIREHQTTKTQLANS
jgi:uncharacterized protein YdcH (DUF465 family)